MSASRLAALLAAAAAALLACGGSDACDSVAGPAVVVQVDLSPDDPQVALGETLRLDATPRSACGNPVGDAAVAWSSSEPAVASVSPTGDVTGESLGTSVITASSEGVSADVTVTVSPPQVAEVEVTPGGATIAVDETVELAATARDADGEVITGRPVTWSSSDAGVASVSSAGVVTGESAGGPVTITATIEGIAGTATISVTAAPGPRLVFQVQPQDGAAGSTLAPVRVAVVDAQGEVITDDDGGAITIGLGENPGAGTLSGDLTATPQSGIAVFDDLRLDRVGTGYTLVASRADASPGTSAPFAIGPGEPDGLEFATSPANGIAGAQLRPIPSVRVVDRFGNPVPTDGRTVTVSLAANPAGGTLSGTLIAATVAGVASFPDLVLDRAGAGYALRATSGGLDAATSDAFSIGAGAAAALRFGQQPTAVQAGAVIAPPVTLLITDAFGNPTGAGTTAVTLTLEGDTDGTLGGTTTRNAAAGVATFNDLTVSRTGDYVLSASASGLTGAKSVEFRVLAGVPTRLAFRVQPSDVQAGAAITPAVQVEILDAAGNVVDADDDTDITVALAANPGAATLGGDTSQEADDGVATFAGLTVNRPAAGYRLGAAAEGLEPATSDPFEVETGAVTTLEFTVQPSNGTAGLVLAPPVTVTLRDAAGNIVTGATGAVTMSLGTNPTNAPLQGTLSVTPVAGLAVFADLRVDVAAAGYRLRATTAGIEGNSNTFAIQPGVATKLRFLGETPNPREDRDITPPIEVAVSDAFDNIVPVDALIVTLSLGQNPEDAFLRGTTVRFTADGIATFNNIEISESGSGFTLRASSIPLTPAETQPFTVRN